MVAFWSAHPTIENRLTGAEFGGCYTR